MRLRKGLWPPMLFACFVFLFFPSTALLRAQTFNLQTGRQPIASLDGLWRFHTGDNPAWASPNFDDSQWPLLRSDESWTKQGYPDYGGYAWYRFTIQVPDGSKPLSLLLPSIYTGYQVYANGKLIGGAGSATPTRDPVFAQATLFPLRTGHTTLKTIQIVLRVWQYKPFASFGARGPSGPAVGGGPSDSGGAVGETVLLSRYFHEDRDTQAMAEVNQYAYCLLAALVGLTILVLFLFRTDDREYLWFAILVLAGAAGAALILLLNPASVPYLLWLLSQIIVSSVSGIASLIFFSIILHARRSFLWWGACVSMALQPLGVALFYFQCVDWGVSHAIGVGLAVPAYIWIIATLSICALKKDKSARLLLVPTALLYGYRILDHVLSISVQIGWLGKPISLDIPLLAHPFPLYPEDVINYIFILALLIFLVRRFSLARQEETRLSNEMEAARNVQSYLVPATEPNTPGFSVESVYIPASEVGGDFFQILPGDDGSLLIVVGDVSGKGLKAAMTVSTIVGALRDYPARQPAEILAHLNRVLRGQIKGFVTCCAALISDNGAMTIANAGHIPPYRNGEEMAVAGGLPLGIVTDGEYAESHHQLAPGDRLTFVSDGVVEATNDKRELFGFDRTQAISNQSANSIAEAAKQFGQEDDITVVTVARSQGALHAI
jgi:sigma-B regulation protein RsbU (phosphoserine phosphatase)